MRVGILSLIHESNTFLTTPTTIDSFRRDGLLFGDDIRTMFAGGNHEISGFLEGLAHDGVDAVPIFYASTLPSGVITRQTCDQIMTLMFEAVVKAGGIDGFLVAPHGANAGEGQEYRDLDGHWLTRLRRQVGAEVPVIAVMDPHGNLSPRMVGATTAGITYRTNPHLDQKARGLEAAEMMVCTLRGEISPTQAAAFPPMIMNIERQNTAEPHYRPLADAAESLRRRAGVLAVSIGLGFPYADVEEMGSSVIVVTDNNPALARRYADELAATVWESREAFLGKYLSVSNAVDRALQQPGPVGLLDIGDNVGAGSPADGTVIAHELHRRAAAPAFVCIYDALSARQAIDAGIGQTVLLSIGGRTDDRHGPPLQVPVTVRRVSEGKFTEHGVVHGGKTEYDIGPVVTVQTLSQLTINLTQQRVLPFSIGHVTCCGLDPKSFQVIVAKGVHAPVPALKPFCTELLRVNTPGVTSADLSHLTYRHRRQPLFPFEQVAAER